MFKKKPRLSVIVVIAAGMVVMLISGLLVQFGSTKQRYVISSGGEGGVYYAFSQRLARFANEHLTDSRFDVISSNGSVENLSRLQSHECDFAIVQSDVAGGSDIAGIANLYQEVLHLIARKDSNIERYLDLDGKTISLGPLGSGTAEIATNLLSFALPARIEFTARNLTSAEAGELLSQGEIDAAFFMSGIGAESIKNLLDNEAFYLVPLLLDRDDNTVQDSIDIVDGFRTAYPQAIPSVIPLGTYGGSPDEPVPTVGVFATLVCNSNTDNHLVYSLTQLIFSQKPLFVQQFPIVSEMDEDSAKSRIQFPLHAGADSYYRRTQPSFLQENAESIGLMLSACLALWAIASGIRKKISINKKDYIDTFYVKLREIEHRSKETNNIAEVFKSKDDLEKLKSHALEELIAERLTADNSYVIFLQMIDHLYLSIEKKEQSLTTQ